MKTTKSLWATAIAAVMICFAGCSDNDNNQPDPHRGEPASLIINLVGNPATSRATVPATDQEKAVHHFCVYVFNNDNNIEAKETVNDATGITSKIITGLTTGSKKVVVLANLSSYPDFETYTDISATSPTISLTEQIEDLAPSGLAMSGVNESINLVIGQNTENVILSRIVSKIRLGRISFADNIIGDQDLSKLIVSNAYAMRVRSQSTYNPGTVTTSTPILGGTRGDTSTEVYSYFDKSIEFNGTQNPSGKTFDDIEFYVFPHAQDASTPTLLTLEGTYNGNPVYFPFRINQSVIESTPENPSSNVVSSILRNMVYTINVEFIRPDSGTNNPETPIDPATLTVTIQVAEWVGEDKNVSW